MAKTFRLSAEAWFQAKDIDDAFEKLARHFRDLADGDESALEFDGSISIGFAYDQNDSSAAEGAD